MPELPNASERFEVEGSPSTVSGGFGRHNGGGYRGVAPTAMDAGARGGGPSGMEEVSPMSGQSWAAKEGGSWGGAGEGGECQIGDERYRNVRAVSGGGRFWN